MKNKSSFLIFLICVIAVTAIVKVICAPNLALSGFSTIIAVSLFAGLKIKDMKMTFLFPLLALFCSDLLIQVLYKAGWFPFAGFYSGQIKNYLLLLVLVLLGLVLRKAKTPGIVLSILAGPLVYFLLSNFQVWMYDTGLYARDMSGLMDCYIAGLPFLKNSLLSTLIFVPSFILLYKGLMKERGSLAMEKN